jgi:hypothetical protein
VSKFRIGDRVEILRSVDTEWGAVGEVGTVIWQDGESVEVSGIGALLAAGRGWFHTADDLALDGGAPTYTREDLIRVVLAQQWAVAIACCDPIGWVLGESYTSDAGPVRRIASLPCAVDVVDNLP